MGSREIFAQATRIGGSATVSSNTATRVVAGIYTDSGGRPGTLLAQGTTLLPVPGDFNRITIPGVTLVAGTRYWITILQPLGSPGTLRFRDHCCGYQQSTDPPSHVSRQTTLVSLPATWTTGKVWPHDAPITAYAAG